MEIAYAYYMPILCVGYTAFINETPGGCQR